MSHVDVTRSQDPIIVSSLSSVEERERRLIEAVVALARSLRDERDRLAARLREVERELNALGAKLNARGAEPGALSDFREAAGADRPRRPSRRRA